MNIEIASVIFEICIALSRRLLLARDYSGPVTPSVAHHDSDRLSQSVSHSISHTDRGYQLQLRLLECVTDTKFD